MSGITELNALKQKRAVPLEPFSEGWLCRFACDRFYEGSCIIDRDPPLDQVMPTHCVVNDILREERLGAHMQMLRPDTGFETAEPEG